MANFGISRLVSEIGDENVKLQNLDMVTENLKRDGEVTQLTFITDQGFGPEGTEQMGLVLWVDRGRFKEAWAELEAE